MHIGNLRAAIFNYICSLQDKSGFILRIEDTDTARNIEGKDQEIIEILKRFGISWQSLYYQSKNLKFHQQFAAKLLSEKKAFCCFCSEEELEAKKQAAKDAGEAYRYDGHCEHLSDEEVLGCEKLFTIRLKKPDHALEFTDAIKGRITFESQNIDSFVIMRADKTPTYNFACACDDMMQGVSFVIRGEDHVSNTPKQNWIRQNLGYDDEIKYAHLPIILNSEGKKMSKREDSSSVKWLLQSGYLPEAIANYLILLGNKTPREVFSMDEAVEFFDIAKISKSPAKFDEDKLAFINREHIKRASEQRLAELFELEPKFAPLIKFYTQEASLIPQIKEKIAAIYSAKDIPQEWTAQAQALREAILNLLSSNGAPMEFNDFKAALSQATNLKGKSLFMPLRFLLTGAPHGPELSELYPLIRADFKEILDATK